METIEAIPNQDSAALRREVDRLKADLSRMRTDLAGLAGDAVLTAKTAAAQAKDRIEQGARAAAAKGRESAEAVEEQVAAHPFMSLTTAFAVGLLVGIGVSRRN